MNFRKALAFSLLAPLLLAAGAHAGLTARHSHAVTLLPDGNLLFTGGVLDAVNTTTGSVQMYNMVTNTYDNWTTDLAVMRSSHTATLMPNGKVLIAGGFNTSGNPLTSIEVCNPATRSCAVPAGAPVLNPAKGGHTATLLSKGANAGKVLICGGQSGAANTTITGDCDLYTPTGDTLADANDMNSPRVGHSAVLIKSGKVLVTGGRMWSGGAWLYEPMNEIYDESSLLWVPKDALLQGRVDHSATVLNNGMIIIAGGFNALNTTNCKTGTEEECWTEDDAYYWGYDGLTLQGIGSHGYLDGAEYFDPNGGRVVVGENTFGVAPYRTHKHSAMLEPDGSWNMQGGYGNIVRTVFSASPSLEEDTVFYLQRTGAKSARILDTSVARFPIETQLARAVSGRLVDADAYFSRPYGGVPSVAFENVKFYLNHSTAPLDGHPVGTLVEADSPGLYDNIMQLQRPTGSATFEEQYLTSDSAEYPQLTVVSSSFSHVEVGTGTPPVPITGIVTARVGLMISSAFRGIKGTAYVQSGTITDDTSPPGYTISLDKFGTDWIDVFNPALCEETQCLFITTMTFSILGEIANVSADINISSHGAGPPANYLNTAGDPINLSVKFVYTADEVWPGERKPTFVYGRSDIVIREMIFSTTLGFSPKTNTWKDLLDTEASPTLFSPTFNHTAILTPAADLLVKGGRNCEAAPANDCLRANKIFTAIQNGTVFIPVHRGEDGTDWPVSEKLNSKRAFHTSTMLPDGRILTCGGSNGASQLATCELMDPDTRKWTATAPMTSPRARHTATLLPNGNVLVTGGVTPSSAAIKTAEIFYPDTQRWVPTSSMGTERNNHTATPLPDGNVLVTGGGTQSGYTNTTEIYISSTAQWLVTGPLATSRQQHTATLLKNGRVLVAGGVNATGATRSAEIFDSSNRQVSGPDATNMSIGRYAHTATQLRDGTVLVTGGSNNQISQLTAEIYNGTAWTDTPILNLNRTSHRALLLPNGKVMVTGGETAGAAQNRAESFDPDFRSWSDQGKAENRSNHTSVLTKDNYILNIGGWDGGEYLDTTDLAYFSHYPDMDGLATETTRQAIISSATVYFNQGWRATLLSDTSNFHGISEASGGGAGPMNSSHHNPRVYLQQMDNISGFMIDLSTRIYSVYDAANPNSDWSKTVSSITVITPNLPGVMPHGWYHMRVAANGLFSKGHTVQVTVPRPVGTASVPTGAVLGTSSITWSWNAGTIASADGYMVYSATDNVFIATASFGGNPVNFTQTGLAPNTAAGIQVGAFNLGGNGPLAKSATSYTLAMIPLPLRINSASFETADLEWARNNNSQLTTYEISMSPVRSPKFSDPLAISTPVPFSVNYLSTSTVITSLSANQMYDFRVRAMNGAGFTTDFSSGAVAAGGAWVSASTITVAGVNNFTGKAMSSSTIKWSWDASTGASYYELYDITNGTMSAVMVGSATVNTLSQTGLSANRQYYTVVSAVKDISGQGPIRGPMGSPQAIYTLTVQPLPGVPNVFSNVSTGSLTANWITNGNSTWTVYSVALASGALSSSYTTIEDSRSFPGLQPNARYGVKVTPINGDGIAGTALDLGYKYTLAKVPASLTADEVSMSGISLSWDPDGNSASTVYELRSSTSEAFNEPVVYHVPFSWLDTGTSALVNGLLTGTSYYFDVAARNGEGFVTARMPALAAFTVAGPGGAPAGSVGGTSDPSASAVISGTLPNNRAVTMTIPAGAFPSATSIAISSSATNVCGADTINGETVAVEIFSAGNAQPQEPITLTISYSGPVPANAANLVLARYNPVSGHCLPLETKVGFASITATLNHFSLFQVMVRAAASNLNNVLVYPNPFYPNRGQGFVTIDQIPANSKVRIYTLSGNKVWESSAGSTGMIIWKGLNSTGNLVASGIYLAVIDSSAGKKVLKLAVER